MEPTGHYEQERRQKLAKLRELGVDPYGQRTPGIQPLAAIKSLYKPEMGHDGGPETIGAGRVMLKRDMGKLSFLTLRDDSGDLQVALDKKRLSERDWQVRDLIDLGDHLVVAGKLGQTNKGETTIWASSVSMAAKALLPPPAKWEGLSDVELRYRQRYVDLWANPEVMRILKLRMRIVDEIRRFLMNKGFVEVETPMMQTLAGGAAAKPFVTHHNALDIPLFMRIAPELYLKRLLVGGFSKVFELNRNFRNEGISPRHNPEFTMLEIYEAFGNWETMADLIEEMITTVAQNVFGTLQIEHPNGRKINLQRPWRRVRLAELVHERTGWKFDKLDLRNSPDPTVFRMLFEQKVEAWSPQFRGKLVRILRLLHRIRKLRYSNKPLNAREERLFRLFIDRLVSDNPEPSGEETQSHEEVDLYEKFVLEVLPLMQKEANQPPDKASATEQVDHGYEKLALEVLPLMNEEINQMLDKLSPAEQLIYVYEKLIEPTLIDPVFVTDIPSVIIPLARENKDDPFFADVYELAINGVEISPGYTELNDPDIQAKHFAHQVGDKDEQQKVDDDFLNALRYGMPPAGGLGMGIDRLVMMLTGAESIRDVILFPLMKPRENG